MLQWAVVAIVVLASAVHVAWTLLPAAWQARWRARIGLAPRQSSMDRTGTGSCGNCGGCAGTPALSASENHKVIRIVPRG